jgi:integrase
MRTATARIEKAKEGFELFDAHLKRLGMSDNTRASYLFAVRRYAETYGEVNKRNLAAYRSDLIDAYAPKTVNIRMGAINAYLKWLKKDGLLLKNVKVQQKPFLENVISMEDYVFLKESLKKDGKTRGFFMIRFLAATGARVSEFVGFKVEHVKTGHVDLYGKGGKMRRIYFPESLRRDALLWLGEEGRESGWLFPSLHPPKGGDGKMTTRGISSFLRSVGKTYGIDKTVMHPHSFRHLFGKTFFDKTKDLAFLADLMGHESLDTTRIYTRKTATEQRAMVDKVVIW